MARTGTPTWSFALVAVRLGRRFLIVKERKHGQGWYLPAGRVEPGESFQEAAIRETLEEAGVPIELEGILRVEHTPSIDSARMRVIFAARPADDTPPRSTPNEHSLEARWATIDEMRALPLRGGSDGFVALLDDILKGRAVHPLSLLGAEGSY